MAFQHGSKALCYLSSTRQDNISGYLSSIGMSAELDTADVSVMGNTAKQYVVGLAGGSFNMEGKYDGTLDTIMTAAVAAGPDTLIYLPQGDASDATSFPNNVGYPALGSEGYMSSYEVNTDVGDAGTWSSTLSGNVGVEAGVLVKRLGAVSGIGNGTGWPLSGGVATTNGGVLYVIATAATALTVQLFGATTFGGTYSAISGATTGSMTGGQAKRIAFSGSVPEYVRCDWSGTSGTFVAVFIRK